MKKGGSTKTAPPAIGRRVPTGVVGSAAAERPAADSEEISFADLNDHGPATVPSATDDHEVSFADVDVSDDANISESGIKSVAQQQAEAKERKAALNSLSDQLSDPDVTPVRGMLTRELAATMTQSEEDDAYSTSSSFSSIESLRPSGLPGPLPAHDALPRESLGAPPQQRGIGGRVALSVGVLVAASAAAMIFTPLGAQLGIMQAKAPAMVVQSTPAGADVKLDGRVVGQTPLRLDGLQAGIARVTVEADGYQVADRELTLADGETGYVDVTLLPETTNAGSVAASSNGSGEAETAKDGKKRGRDAKDDVADQAKAAEDAADDDGKKVASASRRTRKWVPRRARRPARSASSATSGSEAEEAAEREADEAVDEGEDEASAATTSATKSKASKTAGPKSQAEPAPEPKPVAREPVIREPVAVKLEKPMFPSRAKRRGVEKGWVKVQFTVGTDGRVHKPHVVSAYPQLIFDDAALSAVRDWRYKPATADGKPVARKKRIKLYFRAE